MLSESLFAITSVRSRPMDLGEHLAGEALRNRYGLSEVLLGGVACTVTNTLHESHEFGKLYLAILGAGVAPITDIDGVPTSRAVAVFAEPLL